MHCREKSITVSVEFLINRQNIICFRRHKPIYWQLMEWRLKNWNSIAQRSEAQRLLNSRVSKPVEHISLDFSAQDQAKLFNKVMTRIAQDYMSRMEIVNTQYIIGRHYDKEHPHLHVRI